MQKGIIIILISLFVSPITNADTCPPADNINPRTPPGGWALFLSPHFQGQNPQVENFYFVSATHSLNPTYYKNQVFCQYETCSTFGCPRFTLISTATYQLPASDTAPWNTYPQLTQTVVCSPKNHDPFVCTFTNPAGEGCARFGCSLLF